MNININKIEDVFITKGYLDGIEKELQITGDETINEVFEMLQKSKTVEEVKIEELEKEKAELQNEVNVITQKLDLVMNSMPLDVIKEMAVEWNPDEEYERFSYVEYNGDYYKLIHPKRSFDTTTPDADTNMYEKIGGVDEDTGLQELTPSVTNLYKKGDIGTYNGHVFQSNYDDNGVTPNIGDIAPAWWTDLGTIEEYKG